MRNPFSKSNRRPGAPSLRPTAPQSAETPMQEPITKDAPVDKPIAPPSAETPMKPPSTETEQKPPDPK